MKKYRDIMNEMNDDDKPSKKDYRLREEKKNDKRMKNVLRSKNYQDLIDLDEEE